MQTLADRLTGDEVRQVFEELLQDLTPTARTGFVRSMSDVELAVTIPVLAVRLRLENSDLSKPAKALDELLSYESNPVGSSALSAALFALTGTLTTPQADRLVLKLKMPPDPLSQVLTATSLQSVAKDLSPMHARTAIDSLLGGNATDPAALRAEGKAMQALAERLEQAQAVEISERIRKSLDARAQSPQLEALATAMQGLAARLPSSDAEEAAEAMRRVLAWSESTGVSRAAANALVVLVPKDPPEQFVTSIVEAMKYPTAVAATDLLLKALLNAIPRMPDPASLEKSDSAASLGKYLEWIRQNFLQIDVNAAPKCPKPFRSDLTCPPIGT